MSLKQKGLQGFFWTFGQQFGVQVIQFIVSIIMARVLMPQEYGLLGMLAIFMGLGNSLMDSGMSSSLIRTQNADHKDFSTVFFIDIIASFIIYAILFLASPIIADFFDQPILEDIIKIYCLLFIFRAFSSVQYTRLTMLMDFKTQTVIRIPASMVSSILGIILAFKGFGVWSLVYMQLSNGFLETVSIWLTEKWRPSFMFDRERFRHHFNLGYKLTLSGIVNIVYENSYHIVIGKFFSAAQLGFYTRAQAMKQLPVNNISNALNKVTYPLFSSMQDDNVQLKNIYKKLMQQVLFWVAPLLVIGGVLGEPLFRYLMTEKWLPAVVYFQILCLEGILYPLHAYNLNILNVKGRSDLFLRLEITKKVLITCGLVVAIPFGIYGLLWMQLALSFIAFFINTYYSGKMIAYPVGEQLKDIIPILGLAGVVGFLVYIVDFQMPNIFNFDIIRLVTGTLLGMGTYILISYITRFNPLIDFRQLILKR